MAGDNTRYISSNTYRALLARSGNRCAFPGCPKELINSNNKNIGQLCHIESVSDKLQRHNANLQQEDLNGYDNLMFMCYEHHVETNDENVYTVIVMKKIKYDHENKYVKTPFQIDLSHLYRLKREADNYWSKVEELISNPKSSLAKIQINTSADYPSLSDGAIAAINKLEKILNEISPEIKNDYWQTFNIEVPDNISKVKIMLRHMLLKFLEAYVLANPEDLALKNKLEQLRKEFLVV
jgi:hypothetical protein